MSRRAVATEPIAPQPAAGASHLLPSRPLIELTIRYGTDALPEARTLRGCIVKTKVIVPPDWAIAWQDHGAPELERALAAAEFAYTVEVKMEAEGERDEAEADAPQEMVGGDPEHVLSSYIKTLRLPPADADLVVLEGRDVLHEAGLL
jgi:hypothetical protein